MSSTIKNQPTMKAIWKMKKPSKSGFTHIYTIVDATKEDIAKLEAIAEARRQAGDAEAKVVYDDLGRPLYFTQDELEVNIELQFNSKDTSVYVSGSLIKDLKQAFSSETNPMMQGLRGQAFLHAESEIRKEKLEIERKRHKVAEKQDADLNP